MATNVCLFDEERELSCLYTACAERRFLNATGALGIGRKNSPNNAVGCSFLHSFVSCGFFAAFFVLTSVSYAVSSTGTATAALSKRFCIALEPFFRFPD